MYNKIFTKILDSSIWLEPSSTRLIWLTFIAAMDEDGFAAFASVANLAHRARVALDETEAAVKCLEGTDENSSDPDNDGRRIERVPGGWMILNALKYRDLVTRTVIKEQTRARVARHRAKKRACNGEVTDNNDSVTQSDTETQSEEEKPSAAKRASTDDEWIAGLEKKDCYKSINIRTELAKAQVWCETNRRQCTPRFFTNWINRALETSRVVTVGPTAKPSYLGIEWPAWLKEKGHKDVEYQFAPDFLKSDFHRDRKAKQ